MPTSRKWCNGEPRGERVFVCVCGSAVMGDWPQAFCKNISQHNGEQPRMAPMVPASDLDEARAEVEQLFKRAVAAEAALNQIAHCIKVFGLRLHPSEEKD